MNAIQPLWDQMPLTKEPGVKAPEGGAQFTDIFETAIDAVKETDAESAQMEYLMATGQLDNPSLALIAQYKATTAVDLLLQLRNKAMEAYSELMRISL